MPPISKAKSIRLRPVKPSPGVSKAYSKALTSLVKEMCADVEREVKKAYGEEVLGAQDARLPLTFADRMRKLRDRWQKRFEKEANSASSGFARAVRSTVRNQRQSAFKDSKLPAAFSVNFDKGFVSDEAFQNIITENASLIKSIASQYIDDVEGIVLESVTAGRDIKGLADKIHTRYGVTMRRADFIARDQNNKATEALCRAQDAQSGITRGIWKHIGGRFTSRHTHKEMDGKEFNLNEGLWDSEVNQKVVPGYLPGCQCYYEPILPIARLWKN